MGLRRKRHRADLQRPKREQARETRRERPVLYRPLLVAADKAIGWGVEVAVESSRDAVLLEIDFAGRLVGADLVRLEERTEAVVVDLRDRVELVIVALGAVHRQTEERLRGVLDGLLKPAIAVEQEILPRQEAGGAETVEVVGIQFVRGEHLAEHLVVALVGVEGLEESSRASARCASGCCALPPESPPVRVAPHIHPVPAPALAVARRGQQSIDHLLVGIRRRCQRGRLAIRPASAPDR